MNKRPIKAIYGLLMMLVLLFACSFEGAAAGRADHTFVDSDQYGWPARPDVDSETAIVVELNSGTVIFGKDAHKQMYPASITKIMTALLAIENLPMDQIVSISQGNYDRAASVQGNDPYRFLPGETMNVRDALYAVCLLSSNSMASALAEALDGTETAFVERMNARAKQLGALNTQFQNANGLDNRQHLTTAYDMAKILWGAADNETYCKIAGTGLYVIRENLTIQGKITCTHTHYMLQTDNTYYYDTRVICGKTGYIDDAGYTLATYVSDGNLDLIIITMRASSKVAAHEDHKRLMNYAFEQFSRVEVPQPDIESIRAELLPTLRERYGEEGEILMELGEQTTSYADTMLVPNGMRDGSWTYELVQEDGAVNAVFTFDGHTRVIYPVEISYKAPETTQAETTEESTEEPTTEAETLTEAEPTGESQSDLTSEQEEWLKKMNTTLILVLSIALVLCFVIIAVLLVNNSELKKRNHSLRRRLQGKEEEQ